MSSKSSPQGDPIKNVDSYLHYIQAGGGEMVKGYIWRLKPQTNNEQQH
jgi:hypothetical protein